MDFFAKLRKWLNPPSSVQSQPDPFEKLVWLEQQDSPVGVRVLDCRPIADTFLSAAERPENIAFLGSAESRIGDHFCGQSPDEAIRITCSLNYQLAGPIAEGPLFLASVMEDKWNIYHYSKKLYFARSWTGQLHYVAHVGGEGTDLQVVEIEAWPGNVIGEDPLAVRQVDFLIKTHIFNEEAPHPVPDLGSKKAIALWSFSQYGRRGRFAAVENKMVSPAKEAS